MCWCVDTDTMAASELMAGLPALTSVLLKRFFLLSHFATAARKWSTKALGKHRETVHTVGMNWGKREKIYSHTSVLKERKSLIPLSPRSQTSRADDRLT